MFTVILTFSDGELIRCVVMEHVFEMWQKEMKNALKKLGVEKVELVSV